MTRHVDVAIIGAGTAGLAAMAQVRRAQRSFVLIDGGELGTTCARVGCMPSKALLQVAEDFARRRQDIGGRLEFQPGRVRPGERAARRNAGRVG